MVQTSTEKHSKDNTRKTVAKPRSEKSTVGKVASGKPAASVKKSTESKKSAVSSKKSAVTRKPAASGKNRGDVVGHQEMVAVAAYFRAEHRGFDGGDPVADWLEAEAEIYELFRNESRSGVH